MMYFPGTIKVLTGFHFNFLYQSVVSLCLYNVAFESVVDVHSLKRCDRTTPCADAPQARLISSKGLQCGVTTVRPMLMLA